MLTKQTAHRKDTSEKGATFTHQHFREVARIIRTAPYAVGIRQQMAECFAMELAGTNPNFSRARFLAACQAEA